MALVLADRVKETTTTTGTGTLTLAGADGGFQTFAAVGNSNTTYYCIAHQTADEFEIGIGTYTSSGTTLSRDTILVSTNSNNAVSLSAGTKDVFVVIPEDRSVIKDANNIILTPKLSSGTHVEGGVFYDTNEKTLAYYNDETEILHEIGVEEHVRIYNNTGSTISKGKPLYFSGNITTGGETRPTVALANATNVNKYNAQGLSVHDIENNTFGYMCISGLITGIDTSSLSAGDNFFVGLTDGAIQNASPVYPNFPMCLGWVVKSDASTGIVLVNQQNHSVRSFRVQTSAHIGSDLIVEGDLTVNGTQTTTSSTNVEVGAAFTYLNAGDTIGESGTTFTGTGLDDAFFSGHFNGTASTTYYVRIDGTGTPDTFEWSKDNFSTTEATGVAITGAAQTLDSGIEIDFGATTGHTSGDKWVGTAAPTNVDTGLWSNRNTGTSGVGYTHIGLFFDVTDAKWKLVQEYDPEPSGTINTSHASFNTATLVASTFEGALTGNVTGDVTGDVTGNADTATTLETARTIGGVSFNGSANIDLPGVNTAGTVDTSGNAATATALETARTIGGVSFDGTANINLPGVNTAGTVDTSGNAATATALETARTIGGVSFDGTANINLPGVNTSGNQDTTGNANTATTLATSRNIALTGDVTGSASFNGSANASITATLTTANFSLSDFTNDRSEVTTTTPTDATGKPDGYVWYVVA